MHGLLLTRSRRAPHLFAASTGRLQHWPDCYCAAQNVASDIMLPAVLLQQLCRLRMKMCMSVSGAFLIHYPRSRCAVW